MSWKTAILIAAAALAMGAGKAPKAKAPPAKPAAAAKAPAPAPAAPKAAPVDSRDPARMIDLLATLGAQGVIVRKEADAVFVSVTSTAANFSIQFAGCDAQGHACKVMVFDEGAALASPSFVQLNDFNQASATCRMYQDKTGKPHVVYSTLVFADDSRERMGRQLAAWQGCIGDFQLFVKDPNGFLASAP